MGYKTRIKVEYWKTSGKWYTTEEVEVNYLDELEDLLKRGFVASTYIINNDGSEQPYRWYML